MVKSRCMSSIPEVSPGSKFRLNLNENSRTTGGAFQIWRGEELIYQGSGYGTIQPEPAPDVWRPIGLVNRQGADFLIFLYVPTVAVSGEYELRIATTMGSRSGRFTVLAPSP